MRAIFIQILFLSLFFNPELSLGSNPSDKTAVNWANQVLNKMNFEQQLSQLLWVYQSENGNSEFGGLVTSNPEIINKENDNPLSYSILNVYSGVRTSSNSNISFPSFATRKEFSPSASNFANDLYGADFVIDMAPQPGVIFYGIEIQNSKPKLTPHFEKDSLLVALSIYDQVWWLQNNDDALNSILGTKKASKKVKKVIRELSKNALIKKYQFHKSSPKKETSTNFDNYTRWAWNQYSANISLINNPGKLPIKTLDNGNFYSLTFNGEEFNGFKRHLNFYVNHSHYNNVTAFDDSDSLNSPKVGNIIVPATYLSENQIRNLNKLSETSTIFLAWFSLALPPKELSSRITQIQIPERTGVTEALVPQLIFGALGFVSNKNPITYAPPSIATFPIGRLQFAPPALAFIDSETLSRIDTLMENGILEQATPGSQILVSKNGIVIYYQNFGYKTYENSDAIKDNYLYDLASLTKVMATTQAIMFLTERGLLDVDRPIAHYLPEMWGSDKAFIPVREILAHQAGLYPYIPFWKKVLPNRDLEAALTNKNTKNSYQIGANTYIAPYLKDSLLSWSIHSKRLRKSNAEQPYGYRYSDIGFIILKTLVERIVNQPIDDFLDQNLYSPLGMNHTTFTPLSKFLVKDIVPTEGNGKFRSGELTGYVNDQNAALLGGVSGHAGLFSNALDLAKLMQLQLQLGTYGGTTFLYPETILNFTKRQYVGNRRGLGWDKPSRSSNGPTAELASQETFGHTGFTGTAAWADPEHQLIFIFLSNRVYPDAGNFKLNQLNIRTRIQSLLYEAIDFNN